MAAATEAAGDAAGLVGVSCAEGWDGPGGVADGAACGFCDATTFDGAGELADGAGRGCCDTARLVGDGPAGVGVVPCCVAVGAA